MHLDLDEDRALLRSTLRDFAREKLTPRAREWDEAGAIDRESLEAGWSLGLVAAGIEEQFGGAGEPPSALTGVVALEELAAGDMAFAQCVGAPGLAAIPLALSDDDVCKAKWLPALAQESLPAATAAWIEPGRTNDALSPTCRFSDGRITGTKALVPAAEQTDLLLVTAMTEAGPACFIVENSSEVAVEEVIGPRAARYVRLQFDGVEAHPVAVSYEHLCQRAWLGSAAVATGVARSAAELAAEYGKERVAFGRAIAQNQSIAFKIADAITDGEASRWMTWRAAWKLDRNENCRREAALAFRYATDAAFRVADDCVQIFGGHGVIRDHLAELYFRNARALAATAGWFMV